jgi:hypothetical protein
MRGGGWWLLILRRWILLWVVEVGVLMGVGGGLLVQGRVVLREGGMSMGLFLGEGRAVVAGEEGEGRFLILVLVGVCGF